MPVIKLISTMGCVLALSLPFAIQAADVEGNDPSLGQPVDPQAAIQQFKVPDGFKVELWAAEPQLKNPVAFTFDEQGRVFVAETFRYKTSVFDIRDHLKMYYDDLACRTVGDRATMIRRFLGEQTALLGQESEVVQLLQDQQGTGHADAAHVFADGFNTILDGIGSGVLARKGKVYYADIPNLWLLQDTNQSGKANVRNSLSYGYGVHFGYTGHDLHGLRIGPDGRLYFSIGDRGLHVTTKEGKVLDYPDMGTVLRCDLDGSNLEVFAYGLRNPQELAFDDHGNLFTGDNNCDHGDAARIVYVVENGDTGWRIANQFSETTPAGVWNWEKLWHLQFPGQAAYILPPIAHVGDGPSGFTHYPGTGFPPAYNDHFFMCDFRGASQISGIHSFAMTQKGAGFDVVDHNRFCWGILSTDNEFSPDSQLYITDWVRGWPQSALGRIYRVYNTDLAKSAAVAEVKKIIAEGMEKRSPAELENFLAHTDQRVRQEAQFEMVDRASSVPEIGRKYVESFTRVALKHNNQLARLHAIWGLGQIGRSSKAALNPILPLLSDKDAEVRAQAAKVLGDDKIAEAFGGLTNLLVDADSRVKFFAAQSLGKLSNSAAIPGLLAMLRDNLDQDVFLRHAGVMGLVGVASKDALIEAGKADWRSVRMAVLLAMRRKEMPEISMFLHDPDPLIVLEAARAISDLPMKEALPDLAALIEHPSGLLGLDWRILNANFRVGTEKNAAALAAYSAKTGSLEALRKEAMLLLANWAKPSPRDRLTGLWRPLPQRDEAVAANALRPIMDMLVRSGPDSVRFNAILVARELTMTNVAPAFLATLSDISAAPELRVEALKGLTLFKDSHLADAVKLAVADNDENVRREGNRLQALINPANATTTLAAVLEKGTVREKQGALLTLNSLKGEEVDKMVADWMDKLIAGTCPKEIQYEVLQAAAGHRESALVMEKIGKYQASLSKSDEFAGFREVLYGGDVEAGLKVFAERADASCVRCHKAHGVGGEVGPELTGIINRHDREYILESILYPNKQIAPGFESVLVVMKGGQSYAGILKSQTDQELTMLSVEDGGLVKVKKADIKSQIKGTSPMPEGMANVLSKQDLRNLVEFLATLK